MRKYNVIPWSLLIALAAMLEQTINTQPTLKNLEGIASDIRQQSAVNGDIGQTVFVDRKKTTTDGDNRLTNEQELEQIDYVLAKYE